MTKPNPIRVYETLAKILERRNDVKITYQLIPRK